MVVLGNPRLMVLGAYLIQIRHGTTPLEWFAGIISLALGTAFLIGLAWLIPAQRRYRPQATRAVVRTVLCLAAALYAAGFAALYSYWGIAVATAFYVLGILLPNRAGRRRLRTKLNEGQQDSPARYDP